MFTAQRFTLLLTVGAFMLFASSASAMCAYNYTDVSVSADFSCGWFCDNNWEMEPGSHDCRPNKGGTLEAIYVAATGAEARFSLSVEAHGWVEIRPSGDGGASFCAYRQDRTLDQCQSF